MRTVGTKIRLHRASAVVLSLSIASAGFGCESLLGLTLGKGLCEGVTCPAKDACHLPGTCDADTGQCSSPVAMDTTPCDDGNACTTGDACQGGACTGAPKACAPPSACHTASTCDPKTGQCSASVAVNQGPCDDGDPCTTGDACQGGACVPGAPKTCAAQDGCHLAGVCDKATGTCLTPSAPDDTICAEANDCSIGGKCKGGTCVLVPIAGAEGYPCNLGYTNLGYTCTQAGTCTDGKCAGGAVLEDGATCNDGSVCTLVDKCMSGVCNPSVDHTWARWDLKAAPPSPRYVKTATVVFDQVTHLTWERVPPTADIAWDAADAHCTKLDIPGYPKRWRLPTRIELASIVDYGRSSPAIDTGFFVGQAAHYWTSSPRPDLTDQFWTVSFVHGYVGTDVRTAFNNLRVRCVR